MGILSFFAPQSEERLHQSLSEILGEYHKVRALLEGERQMAEQLRHVHHRIDTINAAIRHASSLQDKTQRMYLLHQLVQSERQMLQVQRNLAEHVERKAKEISAAEKKTEHAARRIRASR